VVRGALNGILLFTYSYRSINVVHQQNGAQPKVPRYRPAVKFRKISKDTLEKLQKAEDTNSEDANIEDEITDPSDDGNPNSANMSPSTPEPSTEFLIDPDIDINSEALLDMISEEDVVSDKPLNTRTTASAPAPAPRPLTVDEAFALWD